MTEVRGMDLVSLLNKHIDISKADDDILKKVAPELHKTKVLHDEITVKSVNMFLDTSKKVCRLSKIWQEIEALPEQEELPGQMPRFLDEGEISNLKDWEAQQRLSRAERRVEERKIDLIRGEIAVETML